MSYLIGTELQQHQSDVLIENLSVNPLLPKSTMPSANKALNTTKQNVIQGINEILASFKTMQGSVNASLTQQNSALGNITDATVLEKLHLIDVDVISAIVKLNADIQDLKQQKIRYDDFSQTFTVSSITPVTEFVLKYKPCSPLQGFVNGLMYESGWTYDKTTNTVTWISTAANDGFDIVAGENGETFAVTFIYDFLFAENTVEDPANP